MIVRLVPGILCAFLLAACATEPSDPDEGERRRVPNVGAFAFTPPPASASGNHVLLAAGDIADCDEDGDALTADLLDDLEGTVVPLGDLAYDDGTQQEFERCYGPTWGRHKARTLPVLGNHEYELGHALGYFGYFGAAAGDPARGYHSTDIGAWHVIVLNSNCGESGGCEATSPQTRWLRADLAASDAECTIALWHNPVFSSGQHGGNDKTEAWWEALYEAGADIVLNGHDHNYERFAPQDPSGSRDPSHGITQFVVGTGGKTLREMNSPIRHSQVRDDETYGILEVTLSQSSAQWEFIPAGDGTFTDSGSLPCHGKPSD